jgi:hypothetical protein
MLSPTMQYSMLPMQDRMESEADVGDLPRASNFVMRQKEVTILYGKGYRAPALR